MLYLGIRQIGIQSTIKNSHNVQKFKFFARLVIDFKHSRYPDSNVNEQQPEILR